MKDRNNQQPTEEEGNYDDAVIGKGVKISAILLLMIAVMAGGVFLFLKRKPPVAPAIVTKLSAPESVSRASTNVPMVQFKNVIATSGITFAHNNGAYGEKLLPETMGSGVAVFDFNGDGFQDLLFVNGNYWSGHMPEGKKPTTPALYQNDGKGHFTDVTAGSGLDQPMNGMGVAVGDFDNDGLPDIFLTGVNGNKLYHNQGNGKFEDVTEKSGVSGGGTNWSTSAAWIDYDNDGRLDLFVCNYVKWSRDIDFEVGYKLVGIGRAYGQPMNFEGSFPILYHNEGNGIFKDVSKAAGIQIKNTSTGVPVAKSLGVAPIDLDGDGWIDLVVANDTVQNFVFHNERDGTFKEIGASSGIAFDSYGNTRGAMGIDAARYRNDQTIGIAIGNFATEPTALYLSQKNPLIFADETITEGIGPASRMPLKFGLFFFDYDLDGRQDLLTANGHLEEEIRKIQANQTYRQPAQLFWNTGGSDGPCFVPVSAKQAGVDLFEPIVGRGSAFGDFDGDGDLDVVLTQTGGVPLVLRNDQNLNNSFLRLKLVGTRSNRDAIGAWVRVKVGNEILSRQIMPTRSYLSQSELPVTIGLGKNKAPAEIEIAWPGGATERVPTPPINKLSVIRQSP
ncbi:MAG: hypothetical protein JWN25_2143 [Verrucomicrobiales bacterium]|nr:hypothetical protein [Verrucomicrobiales bacterium]